MNLGIYGAGGLGREVLTLAREINAKNKRWNEIVFIDDINPGRKINNVDVVKFESVLDIEQLEVVVAVGEPSLRCELMKKIKSSDLPLATLVHPEVNICTSTFLGEGVVVCKEAFVSCDCVINNNVYLQPHVCIGHDCQIGENSIISPGVMLGGNCKIGSGGFLGMNACIKENTHIGNNVIISMGSVVFSDIKKMSLH